MPYGITYTVNGGESQEIISPLSLKGLSTVSLRNMNTGGKTYTLPISTITVDTNFGQIYNLWIAPCVNYMWGRSKGKIEENTKAPNDVHSQVKGLFLESGDGKKAAMFLKKYREVMTAPFPHTMDPQNAENLCASLDEQMAGAAAHLCLRVKVVCILAGDQPKDLFDEGQTWISNIPLKSDDFLEVREGMTFQLDPLPKNSTGLAPRTLRNSSSKGCTIRVQYFGQSEQDNRVYRVKFPPWGILRGLFSDGSCGTLTSLKGNISCSDTCRAIIQGGKEKGLALSCATRFTDPMLFPKIDFFLDAAADEMGGAVILTPWELYSTIDSVHMKKGDGSFPVRCYRSGNQWARLRADGHLDSNLPHFEQCDGITAVVEDGATGLLVCGPGVKDLPMVGDPTGAVEFSRGVGRAIPVVEFCDRMMTRFQQESFCEVVETQLMRYEVRGNGEIGSGRI